MTAASTDRLRVAILGTAPPRMTFRAGNAGTGLLVRYGDLAVMIDCGPGVTNRVDAMGVDLRSIGRMLLTHHHWDHVGDLAAFVLGRWEESQFGAAGGRPFAAPLALYGPAGTARFAERLFGPDGAFANDIASRFAEDVGLPLYGTRDIRPPFPPVMPEVMEVVPGAEWTIGPLTVRTSEARHCEPYLPSLAYRIESPGGTLVFSGDTAPCEAVENLARGADLLLHDCNIREEVRAGLGRTAIHSTAREVAGIAAAAGVKHVVAVHHGVARADEEGRARLAQAICAGFPGQVTVAVELTEIAA